MATFTKKIPYELVNEVIEAYAYNYNYQDKINDGNGNLIDNPESKVEFAKRMDREYTINIVKKYRVDALEIQRETTLNQVDTDYVNMGVE